MEQQARRSSIRGFTLIELLIVVAIIAILAAIAVPNFLEAQTRAKIARVKADMRTVATGLESYAVDWNRVPPGFVESIALGMTPPTGVDRMFFVYFSLTTPVAYLSSIPMVPFTDKATIGAKGSPFAFGGSPAKYESIPDVARQEFLKSGFTKNPHWAPAARNGYTWLLESIGPSRRQGVNAIAGLGQAVPNWMSAFYDATNGTVSDGNIIRSNKMQH